MTGSSAGGFYDTMSHSFTIYLVSGNVVELKKVYGNPVYMYGTSDFNQENTAIWSGFKL